uniref:Transposase n=1 Tax=Haemonchus placei TaxID=6290 RepID=A0A0N4WHM1_HAEPC
LGIETLVTIASLQNDSIRYIHHLHEAFFLGNVLILETQTF